MASDGRRAVPAACYKSAMLLPRTFKILLALLGGYMLLALPAYVGPVALQEISAWLAAWGLGNLAVRWTGSRAR